LELTIHDFVFSTYVHIISPLLKGSLELKAILLSDEFTSFMMNDVFWFFLLPP